MTYLTEPELLETVSRHIRNQGFADWADIRTLVERTFVLTEDDLADLPGSAYDHRYLSQINNLGANKSIIKNCTDIQRVDNGFATTAYAVNNNLNIRSDVDRQLTPRTPRTHHLRVTREQVIADIVEYYQANKEWLVDEVRTQRDNIVTAVLAYNCSADADVKAAVELEMEQFNKMPS